MPNPLNVEAVWVGIGTAADFAGRDVRGKAVVYQAMLAPGDMGNSARIESVGPRARDAGAAMTIGIWGYAENMGVIQGSRAQETMPGFSVGYEDGKRLRELIEAGPVRISASIDVDIVEGLSSASQYGMLPGTTDETIIITAHQDGWFDAALDNASGLAVMVALAEHFAQIPREQRRRNMIFVGTAGHHVGSPNSPYMRDSGCWRRPRSCSTPSTSLRCSSYHTGRSFAGRRVSPPGAGGYMGATNSSTPCSMRTVLSE